jgi:dolichol-phosphate mannosyltransferase
MNDERVKSIRRVSTRGLASAINRGIIETRGEIIGWMDADQSMPASMLPLMIEKLQDYDVVIGSRYAKGGQDVRPWIRVVASRLINGLATFVLGYGIMDYDSGFIIMKRQVLDRVTLMPTGYGSYFVEFIYACCKKGLKVLEVPYKFNDRIKGTSKSAPSVWQFLVAGMSYGIRIFIARLRHVD